jgi:hypothetical protein
LLLAAAEAKVEVNGEGMSDINSRAKHTDGQQYQILILQKAVKTRVGDSLMSPRGTARGVASREGYAVTIRVEERVNESVSVVEKADVVVFKLHTTRKKFWQGRQVRNISSRGRNVRLAWIHF